MNIPVIYGSVRSQRQGIRAARFLAHEVERRGHEAPLVDPVEYPLPLLDRRYQDYPEDEIPEVLQQLDRIYRGADAFVFVTGEYNHGVPPALKNLIDHFSDAWQWRPAAIACYSVGDFGGIRAAIQLRTSLAGIGLASVPTILPIPRIGQALGEDGRPTDPDAWGRRAGRFLSEIEWYAEAIKNQRESKGTPG